MSIRFDSFGNIVRVADKVGLPNASFSVTNKPQTAAKHPNPPLPRFSGAQSGLMEKITSAVSIANGFSRPNRYSVIIPTMELGRKSDIIRSRMNKLQFEDERWNWMREFYGEDLQKTDTLLTAFCEKSELPGYQFSLETNRSYGPVYKAPTMPVFQEITMTFLCGSEMLERYFMEAWMHMIMDPLSNNFNYIEEYAVDLVIVQFDERGMGPNESDVLNTDLDEELGRTISGKPMRLRPNYYVRLIEAFPVAINAQELSYDANDSIQKLQVTFTYLKAVSYQADAQHKTRRSGDGKLETFGETLSGSSPSSSARPPTGGAGTTQDAH